jgi:3-dehydroquinate synthase
VSIVPGSLATLATIAREATRAHRYALITDDTVRGLLAAKALASFAPDDVTVLSVAPGEEHKTRETWARLTDALLAAGHGRDSAIIALGGGVIGDVAGFVAATYMRGVPVVQVPTTLLAMIDASIGGKTGVDTPMGKNLVGAFHRPAAVVIDPDVLASLPVPLLRAGFAEAIKHGVIADARYFDMVAGHVSRIAAPDGPPPAALHAVILGSVRIKAAVVREDEREGNLRHILNFGHTIGHAVEARSGFRLLHGEAVAIGMVLEARLAERIGVAATGTAAEVHRVVSAAGLPTAVPAGMEADAIIDTMHADKKSRRGELQFALPAEIGRMAGARTQWTVSVAAEEVRAILSR